MRRERDGRDAARGTLRRALRRTSRGPRRSRQERGTAWGTPPFEAGGERQRRHQSSSALQTVLPAAAPAAKASTAVVMSGMSIMGNTSFHGCGTGRAARERISRTRAGQAPRGTRRRKRQDASGTPPFGGRTSTPLMGNRMKFSKNPCGAVRPVVWLDLIIACLPGGLRYPICPHVRARENFFARQETRAARSNVTNKSRSYKKIFACF